MTDMRELELYKLCLTKINVYDDCVCDELGWINEEQFCVWFITHTCNTLLINSKIYLGTVFLMMVALTQICKKIMLVLIYAKQ